MTTIRVGAEQFRRQLTDLLNRAGYGGDEIIVERNGRPIAVLKPYQEAEAGEYFAARVEQAPILAAQIEEARQAAGISYEDLARQLQAERLRTLQEKYAGFAAEFTKELAAEVKQNQAAGQS